MIPITTNRGILCASLIFGGFVFFFVVSKVGQKLMERYEKKMEGQKMEKGKIIESLSITNM